MSLFKAMTKEDVRTENGMLTNSTSSNPVMDLFFKMGGWTNETSQGEILDAFIKAYRFDRLLATKALFYNRDVREGQGRRRSFRIMFYWMCKEDPTYAIQNIENVPFYGRWDDIFTAMVTAAWDQAEKYIWSSLQSGDSLCAKWMPRENKKYGAFAKFLAGRFGLSMKEYRQLLSKITKVVESDMTSNNWSNINYNHIPSVAINKYRKAFYKHDEKRFCDWIESLSKPESGSKIHADAIYPHDIVKRIETRSGSNALLEAQWKALPNFVQEGKRILPICDVSGSMGGEPMEVCVSLGIYLSERNVGKFKDGFITFSSKPTLQILSGTLQERIRQLRTAHWDMNTNLEAVFKLILSKAVESAVPEFEMPTDILILSDMQFDACVSGKSAISMIRSMYKQYGYSVPNVIFWNLRTASGVPVKYDESGTALVSGFSPSIMKSLLSGDVTPLKMMMKVLGSDRYAKVV